MPVLNFWFTPNYVKAKELIDAGKIGKPLAVWFRELIAAKDLPMEWPANSWAWNIEKSVGYPDFTLSISRGPYTMDALWTDLWSFL
jgi:predicted dehydrogenase